MTKDVPVIAPPPIAPEVVMPKDPRLSPVTPVPVPIPTLFEVVSKSKVRFSLYDPPEPPKVKTPAAEDRIDPFEVVKVLEAESDVNAPEFGVVEPIAPGTAQVFPPNCFASKAAGTAPNCFLGAKTSS